ncbi:MULTISPECIES: hypothetical protein [unclassified Luteococcus]|uniref:hypothetical protein n=1 Tax=unclassified Luteococcus TaxID=2639923 RepID=UPI00313F332B
MKNQEIRMLLDESGGVLRRSDHPQLRYALDWLLRSGQLTSPFPGILTAPETTDSFNTQVKAAALWRPDAVLIGDAAARLGFQADRKVSQITMMGPGKVRSLPGCRIIRGTVPPEHRIDADQLHFSAPAWTAVWLSATDQGETIDEVLRQTLATPADLDSALETMAGMNGQAIRRFVVENSRSEPWSQAERRFHMFLRKHEITGWHANRWVEINGMTFPVDVLFDDIPLAIEVMSWSFHGNQETFHRDNDKIAGLVELGWVYLPVTWPMLEDETTLFRRLNSALLHAGAVKEHDPRRARRALNALRRHEFPGA